MKNYECDGQLSFEDVFVPKKEQNQKCTFSGHECNKQELWKVADSLDEMLCPHTCCRKCSDFSCGARCNGAPNLHQKIAEDKVNGWHPPVSCDQCDVAFGSLICFERRGYFYLRHKHEWLKGPDGKPVISKSNRLCNVFGGDPKDKEE